jgi:hypothetical protein
MARDSPRLSRRAGTAVEAETIAIVCEGEKTEVIYFNGIRTLHRLATARVQIVGLGADPLTVVKEAELLQRDYDHVWAVFDVEASGAHATSHRTLKQAIARAERAGIHCAISHPCFELWLLLHFRPQTAYLNNEAARSKVRQCRCGYDAKGFDFRKVWPHHRTAIDNARVLDLRQRANITDIAQRNPWTTVYELVEQVLRIAKSSH